jgi:hypothetical protein
VTHLPLGFTEYQKWRQQLKTWTPVCKGTDLECWFCGEKRDYITFQSPDRLNILSYDICPICARKLGLMY